MTVRATIERVDGLPGEGLSRTAGGRRYPAWLPALGLLLLVGLGLSVAPVGESPGRWAPNPRQAVVDESRWILHYAVLRPRVGDRIPDALFVALIENERGWARECLTRQRDALMRAASRLPGDDAQAWSAVAADLAVLDHYQAILDQPTLESAAANGAGAQTLDPSSLWLADYEGRRLHARAEEILSALERQGGAGSG